MNELSKSKKVNKRNNQGLTFCRPDFKAPHLQKTTVCPDCGFHIRGDNHKDGQHHQSGKEGRLRISRR